MGEGAPCGGRGPLLGAACGAASGFAGTLTADRRGGLGLGVARTALQDLCHPGSPESRHSPAGEERCSAGGRRGGAGPGAAPGPSWSLPGAGGSAGPSSGCARPQMGAQPRGTWDRTPRLSRRRSCGRGPAAPTGAGGLCRLGRFLSLPVPPWAGPRAERPPPARAPGAGRAHGRPATAALSGPVGLGGPSPRISGSWKRRAVPGTGQTRRPPVSP